jgi:hypothetical protein
MVEAKNDERWLGAINETGPANAREYEKYAGAVGHSRS